MARSDAQRSGQGLLPFPRRHGGRRAGAGRKPKGEKAGVSHRQRAALASRFPVHVTVKLLRPLPRLRQRGGAFRLVHYAILNDHLHLLVEARDRAALSRGAQGLATRGKVFADRYHDRILRTPREVRNAIRYLFGNARKHAAQGGCSRPVQAIDTFTSAPWFDGFREHVRVRGLEAIVRPVTDARTCLLAIGWRRHGLLSVDELPATG
jgi:hypothetical protein